MKVNNNNKIFSKIRFSKRRKYNEIRETIK